MKFTKPQRRKIYEEILHTDRKLLERGMCYFLSDKIGIWCYYGCREQDKGIFPEFDLFFPEIRYDIIRYIDRIAVMQLCIEMTKNNQK